MCSSRAATRPTWRRRRIEVSGPHGRELGHEPDAIIAGTAKHGGGPGESHVKRGIVLAVAIDANRGGRVEFTVGAGCRAVTAIRRARDAEVLRVRERRQLQRADGAVGAGVTGHDGQVLGAVAEGRIVSVRKELRACGWHLHRRLCSAVKAGRNELVLLMVLLLLVEGRPDLGLTQTHAGPELIERLQREFHESQHSGHHGLLLGLEASRVLDQQQPLVDGLDWRHGEAPEVRGTNFREEPLHEQSNCVVVGDDEQRARRPAGLLQVEHRQPEDPFPERLETVELLCKRQAGRDLAHTLQEIDQTDELRRVLPDVLEVSLDRLELLEGALERSQVFLARLARLVVGPGRRGRRREGATLRDKISEVGLVLPAVSLYGVDDLPCAVSIAACLYGSCCDRLTDEVPCICWVQLRLQRGFMLDACP